MSHLLSKIMLAVFMLPLAGMLYTIVWVMSWRWNRFYPPRGSPENPYLLAGGLMWAFIAVYWYLLWCKSIRWTPVRIGQTLFAALAAIICSGGIGVMCSRFEREFGWFVATALSPVLWLAATTVIWRESKDERTERLQSAPGESLVCPNCGYNLTGLTSTRCPECGAQFTLNELIASQPAKQTAEVEA